MSANILSQAIKGIKANAKPVPPKSDILSRIKKPNALVLKEPKGRAVRQAEREPYSRAMESVKRILGGRFVPKGELKEKGAKWKHDLCPKQDTGKHRVFIRGVPAGTSNDELRRVFEAHGSVLGVNVAGQTADVYFSFKEDAQKAVEKQTLIKGQKVKLMLCEPKPKSTEAKSKTESHDKVLEADKVKDPGSILSRIKKASS
eukprot:TRINITY_DN12578_c0_g1_i1.p1 TRINITY_DN12578_c0_g1~~TRINITY_DN12578_c0_g1_i1.p1  ORF type:complete len:202 (-),score=53.31 TRINITY_DN12578_c0_g1_i1:127-732(-)